jgi:hypothetical protein
MNEGTLMMPTADASLMNGGEPSSTGATVTTTPSCYDGEAFNGYGGSGDGCLSSLLEKETVNGDGRCAQTGADGDTSINDAGEANGPATVDDHATTTKSERVLFSLTGGTTAAIYDRSQLLRLRSFSNSSSSFSSSTSISTVAATTAASSSLTTTTSMMKTDPMNVGEAAAAGVDNNGDCDKADSLATRASTTKAPPTKAQQNGGVGDGDGSKYHQAQTLSVALAPPPPQLRTAASAATAAVAL